MTEYDYSPEAYERYMATQQRIAKWVDKTERHRPEFEHAVPTSSNQNRNSGDSSSSGWRKLFKRSDSPSSSRKQRPADIYIPSPESVSSEEYYDSHRSGSSHGPSPPPSAGYLVPHQQPLYHPMAQPMLSPPPMMVPQPYIQPVPHHSSSSSHRKHHSSRSHSRSRSHHSAGYYNMASPPLSPGYQYAYPSPPPLGGAPAGPYIMMSPQPNGHPGAHIMYLPLR